jgi:hypothetical protein
MQCVQNEQQLRVHVKSLCAVRVLVLVLVLVFVLVLVLVLVCTAMHVSLWNELRPDVRSGGIPRVHATQPLPHQSSHQ